MKILHIINHLAKGGAERLLVDILPLYKQYGQEVAILQLSNKNSSKDYLDILKNGGAPIFSLGSSSLYDPALIFKLRKFIRASDYQVVHVHLFPAMYWASLAFKLPGRNKPVLIFTEHSTQNNRLNNSVFKLIDRFIYRSFASIVAISPAIETKLKKWIGRADKLKLIRNGINIDHFKNAPVYDRSFFRKEFDVPSDSIILLMTARFFYPKDHITVVKALKHLPPDVHLIFAGEGADRESVYNYVIENNLGNRVHFIGFRIDVPSLMKSVDFNILASKYEGMSGVTLEALAAGKPFIGSDVPGINDVVPDNRFVFNDGDPVDLSEKIRHITSNDAIRMDMIRSGLNFAEKFDVSIMIEEHINLYKRLILNKEKESK